MKSNEIEAGAEALCAWLQSQNVSHDRGAEIMARVMGEMIAINAVSHNDLRRMIKDFNKMVTADAESAYLIRMMSDEDSD
jgi:hypothetical protein